MTMTVVILGKYIFGHKRVHHGSWVHTEAGAGAATGDIVTGLKRVETFALTHKGTAVEAAVAVVNETFPLGSGSVTIVCTSGDTGYWIAIGL